jgi:tetratricopeptide (TPR) repeat protein
MRRQRLMTTDPHRRRLVLFSAACLIVAASFPGFVAAQPSAGSPHQSAIKLERTGVMYFNVGHPLLAEPLLEEALTLREQSVGVDHLTVATTLTHLGSVYHALGKDERARTCLQRALAIREKVLGSFHPAVNAVQAELRLLSDRHLATVAE